jgi:hypothetical protein
MFDPNPVFVIVTLFAPVPLNFVLSKKMSGDRRLTVPLKVAPDTVVTVAPSVFKLTLTLGPKYELLLIMVVPLPVVEVTNKVLVDPEFVTRPKEKEDWTLFPFTVSDFPLRSRFPEKMRQATVTFTSNVQRVRSAIVTVEADVGTILGDQLNRLFHR